MNRKRPDWEIYFLKMAQLASTRSTCIRRHVGAVLVKEKKILATGYNGVPSGISHCTDVGCLRDEEQIPSGQRHELCRGLHAEQNAILQAAYHGVSIQGSVLFCTNFPCVICSKMLINAGIRQIFYLEGYPDPLSEKMLAEAGMDLHRIEMEDDT
ncbi:MAG: deoxycytidylate deaminase [Thermodesulfobacteriota bacterium]